MPQDKAIQAGRELGSGVVSRNATIRQGALRGEGLPLPFAVNHPLRTRHPQITL